MASVKMRHLEKNRKFFEYFMRSRDWMKASKAEAFCDCVLKRNQAAIKESQAGITSGIEAL